MADEPTRPRLDATTVAELLAPVAPGDADAAAGWPGPPARTQPVQVLYVPADRVDDQLLPGLAAESTRLLETHAPDPASFAAAMTIDDLALAERVRERVATKLATQPVEDLRVDVEDGYLGRDPATEAREVSRAARVLAASVRRGEAPPAFGIRVKSFADGLAARSVDSLDRFVGTLLDELGELPDGLTITLPKIVSPRHVGAFADVLGRLEGACDLPAGRLRFEAQIETTASVLGTDGRVVLRTLREVAGGRLGAVHLGVYDLTAGLGLPPDEQRPEHPACDLVRQLMQLTFAGTEVWLSDGSVNAVPVDDTTPELHRVWRRHTAAVRHGLASGYVQGWDLHVSHLVSRYAAVHAHLLADVEAVISRLHAWTQGSTAGPQLDEPATVRRLAAQLERAVACGALDADELPEGLATAVVTNR